MSSYVFNPFSPPPKHPKSHVRGWSIHWAESLGVEVADKDTDLTDAKALYLDHGVNFSGGLNLFGGVDDDVFDRLYKLSRYDGHLISLDIPMPNYVDQLAKRVGQSTCHPALKTILPHLQLRFQRAICVDQASLNTPHVTIGDSHSTAFAPAGSAVLRTNGQTLFGALRNNHIETQLARVPEAEKITLVFGSIDVRHHLGRQPDPFQAAADLARKYAERINFLSGEHMVEIEAALPVPIEHEGRKLPKTGYYDGTPFAGSRQLRQDLNDLIGHELEMAGIKTVSAPRQWYLMDGEEFAETYMERGSSVHIAPPFYRRYNWGAQ